MKKRKYFGLKRLIPCYAEEDRYKYCRLMQQEWPKTVPIDAIENLWALAENVLEPVREIYGRPMRVERGFLCWNKRKRLGVEWSYCRGEAVDITAIYGDVREENQKIALLIQELTVFDQLVVYETHLHVSYKHKGNNRKEVIIT